MIITQIATRHHHLKRSLLVKGENSNIYRDLSSIFNKFIINASIYQDIKSLSFLVKSNITTKDEDKRKTLCLNYISNKFYLNFIYLVVLEAIHHVVHHCCVPVPIRPKVVQRQSFTSQNYAQQIQIHHQVNHHHYRLHHRQIHQAPWKFQWIYQICVQKRPIPI